MPDYTQYNKLGSST